MIFNINPARKILLGATILAALAGPVQAQCINAYMTGFDEYNSGSSASKSRFQANELLVICFTVQSSGFMAIYDAPGEGDFEQLYPNALTHPGGETYTAVEAGKQYCLGGRDTFPMYFPEDELGEGKISLQLTRNEGSQLDPGDYAIPGQRVAKNNMERHLRSHARSSSSCTERDVKYLRYVVSR